MVLKEWHKLALGGALMIAVGSLSALFKIREVWMLGGLLMASGVWWFVGGVLCMESGARGTRCLI